MDTERKNGFSPVFNENSRVLILGSFPSVKSRQVDFYYGNKQNRFWKIVCEYFKEKIPNTMEGKREFLLKNNIALWDMVDSCEIVGSADSSIKAPVLVDLNEVLLYAKIEKIFLNGALSYQLFLKKYKDLCVPYQRLPSTSPANVRFDERIWKEELNKVFQFY